MKHFSQLILMALTVCVLAPLGACRDEMDGGANTTGKGIQFNYRVEPATPQEETVQSRAFSVEATEEEKKIEGDIFIAFYTNSKEKEGSYIGYKLCPTSSVSTDINGQTFFTADFSSMTGALAGSTSLDFDKNDYDVLVMANYNQTNTLNMDASAIDAELKKGKNYSEAQTLFRMGRPTEGFKTPFFMSATGTYYHSEKALTISLKRAVSKFVIENGAEGNAFTIKSVQMFNVRDSIYAFDLDGVLASGLGKKGDEIKPASDTEKAVTLYDYETTAENVSTDKYSALCAIIGIKFEGLDNTYYYRLNINVMNDRQRIKRNAIYYVKILNVNGVGAPTPEEAIDSDVTLITSSVPSWDEDFDGVFTYASDGIGFALNTTNLQHHVADVSKVNPHKHVQTLWWRNTAGKVLSSTEIPRTTKVSIKVEIKDKTEEEVKKLLTARWVKGAEGTTEADQEAGSSDPAEYLEIIAYGYFSGGSVTITYTPENSGSGSSVTPAVKTILNSLTPYNEGPVLLEEKTLKISTTIDEADYGGNDAFYTAKDMKYTCPTGMRPPSIVEMMYLLSNSRIDKNNSGMYYLDETTQTQLTLPYTGGTVNGSPVEGAYYWSTSTDWDNSSTTGKDLYIYGKIGDFFPSKGTSEYNNSQNELSLRCVRPQTDADRTTGNKPLQSYIYPTFDQLSDASIKAVEMLIKTINGSQTDITIEKTSLPIVNRYMMYVIKGQSTQDYEYKVTPYQMVTVNANGEAPTPPEGYQIASVENVKKILTQGSIFEKPFYPGNYGDIIVTSDANTSSDGKKVFQVATHSGDQDTNVWSIADNLSDATIKTKKRIYFMVSDTKEDISEALPTTTASN